MNACMVYKINYKCYNDNPQSFAEARRHKYIEVSAKNGENVESMFNSIAEGEVQRHIHDQQVIKVSGDDLEQAHGCCSVC